MIESAIINLIRSNGLDEFSSELKEGSGRQFFAEILLRTRRIVDYDCPTMGVNVTDGINLHINPHFFNNLTPSEQVGVLIHEIKHVIYDHFDRFKQIVPNYNNEKKTLEDLIKSNSEFQLMNMAADVAINDESDIKNLIPKTIKLFDKEGKPVINPETGEEVTSECCTVASLQKMLPKVKVKSGQIMEYYYNLLKQNKDQLPQQTVYVLDDHNKWSEGEQNGEYTKEVVKSVVKQAAEEAVRKAGTLSGKLQQMIDRLNYKPKNWKADLRKFFANCTEVIKVSSRKQRNRRYGILFPGSKNYSKLQLAIGVDVSGSITDEHIAQFFAEINCIYNENVDLMILEFDSQVTQMYKYDPKKIKKIIGRGGTMFGPVFEAASELEIDGLIMLTDGCAGDTVQKPKFKVLWAMIDNQKAPYKWGSVTEIKIRKQ